MLHLLGSDGMPTKQPRKMVTFPEDVISDLEWLLEDERKKRKRDKKKGQFHECHMLAQLIRNEVMIRKTFR